MEKLLPDDATIIGTVTIINYLDGEGELKTAYDVDGISDEAALGYMLTVSDRVREQIKYNWDTCPDCGRPWDEHGEEDEEEEEDD